MRDEAGFTLIEVLAALVAGSLLLVLLGWTVGGLVREWRKAELDPAVAQIEAAAPILSGMIETAIPPSTAGEIATAPDRLELIVSPPDALRAAGPLRLTLTVEKQGNAARLISSFSAINDELPPKAAERRVLVDNLSAVRFDYLLRPPSPRPQLPALVTIAMTTKGGKQLDVAAEPRITAAAGCVFDPVTLECRP